MDEASTSLDAASQQVTGPIVEQNLGRVKACIECRQQKLRCDVHLDYSKPCSRCRRHKLQCVVAKNLRKSQRQTKAELLVENSRLRDLLQDSSTTGVSPTVQPRVPDDLSADSNNGIFTPNSALPPKADRDGSSVTYAFSSCLEMLKPEHIGEKKIDACFALFFKHCEKFLPGILDHKIPPERFYKESPFLFWSIVSVGARRLEDNPGLLEQVTGHIIGLAVSSLYSMSNPIPAIIAVLLLCMWPLPVNTTTKDTSHALAGAAMQLALQHGLHIFGHDQDFYREPPNCRSNDKIWRARLWILCVTVVQSTSICDGLPFWDIPQSCTSERRRAADQIAPTPGWLYRYELHRIQTDAIATISRNLELAGSADESSLDAFINVFDAQVVNAVMKEDKACNRLVQLHARLSIRAFHFFLESEALKKPGTLQVFTIACQLIDIHTSLDALQNWTSWTPHYFARMMLLAAYCILRIVKSELRSCINAKRGEEMFFQAVNLTKNRSTQVNDLDSRNALILRQLWTSHRAFTKRDGTLNGLHLHLKSRLVMSVVFDCFWWWRAEFAGQNFPYAEKDDDQAIEPASAHEATSPAPPESTEGQVNSAELQLLDFDLQFSAEELGTFPDWEWAAGFELPGDLDVSMLDTADLMSTV